MSRRHPLLPANDGEPVVTHQALTDVHKLHGLSRMANVKALLMTEEKRPDMTTIPAKTEKTADDVEIVTSIPAILTRYETDHPPFGLPLVLPEEKLGQVAVTPDGVQSLGFVSAEATEGLGNAMRGWPLEHVVNMIGKLTQRKIGMAMTEAFGGWGRNKTKGQRGRYDDLTGKLNHDAGLPVIPIQNLIVATGNSNSVMWNFLEIVPEVVEREAGRTPTVEEAADIAANSVETLEMLSSSHFHVFTAINARMHVPRVHAPGNAYDSRWFTLRQNNKGGWMLAVKASVLAGLEVDAGGSKIRAMCAALLAQVDGRSVIDHVYQKDVAIAKALVYPKFCSPDA